MDAKMIKVVPVVAGLVALALTACSDDGGEDAERLTVWSLESQTDRVQKTQAAADRFTAATGIEVEIVATDENQFTSLITSAAAAGQMPDVVGALTIAAVWQLHANDLLDTDAAASVVEDLGEDTFATRALELTRADATQLAVPSDTYAMLLVYRQDLFEAAGLPVPDTYDSIRQAAQALHEGDLAGITLSTVPDDIFTAQTFEFLGLANDCQLVDDAANVTLDSAACQQTFELYGELASNYSVPGAQGVDSTRATYFAGRAAMLIWSSFILDELAGLRNDALPSCPECEEDPAFLAQNSGFVTALQGPGGPAPAGYGELTSWVIPSGGQHSDAAAEFVKFMMDDGYLDWLGVAPEGKFPARTGTAENPQEFSEAWETLPAGVDAQRPLGEVYPASVIETLRTSPEALQRWGIEQGEGELVGATLGEQVLPQAISPLTSGQLDAAAAAAQASDAVRSIQESLG